MSEALSTVPSSELEVVQGDDGANPAHLAVASMGTPASSRATAARISRVAEILAGPGVDPLTFPWHRVDYGRVQLVRASLIHAGLKPATINAHLAALKSCLGHAWRLGLMSAEEHKRATDVRGLSGHSEAGRYLDGGELAALFQVCKGDGNAGLRDAAALALLFGAGLRRSEAVKATVDDYKAAEGELLVRQGKNRKDRTVWLVGGAHRAMAAWLEVRGKFRDEDDKDKYLPGPILCPVLKSGRILIAPMSGQALYARMQKRAKDAGIAPFCTHDGRRTLLSNLCDVGRIREGQTIAGHASISTTAKYDRRDKKAAKKALEGVEIPF